MSDAHVFGQIRYCPRVLDTFCSAVLGPSSSQSLPYADTCLQIVKVQPEVLRIASGLSDDVPPVPPLDRRAASELDLLSFSIVQQRGGIHLFLHSTTRLLSIVRAPAQLWRCSGWALFGLARGSAREPFTTVCHLGLSACATVLRRWLCLLTPSSRKGGGRMTQAHASKGVVGGGVAATSDQAALGRMAGDAHASVPVSAPTHQQDMWSEPAAACRGGRLSGRSWGGPDDAAMAPPCRIARGVLALLRPAGALALQGRFPCRGRQGPPVVLGTLLGPPARARHRRNRPCARAGQPRLPALRGGCRGRASRLQPLVARPSRGSGAVGGSGRRAVVRFWRPTAAQPMRSPPAAHAIAAVCGIATAHGIAAAHGKTHGIAAAHVTVVAHGVATAHGIAMSRRLPQPMGSPQPWDRHSPWRRHIPWDRRSPCDCRSS